MKRSESLVKEFHDLDIVCWTERGLREAKGGGRELSCIAELGVSI